MVADGDREKANQVRKDWVHKLGNLTLTGYNPQLSNKSLLDKQNKKNKQGKAIGLQNGLALNAVVAEATSWTQADIERRTDFLVEKALEIFKL